MLLLDFLDEEREWLDVSGVTSPAPSRGVVMRSSVVLAGMFTATDGWEAAEAEPIVYQKER